MAEELAPRGNIFPGAVTRYTPPVSPTHRQIASWGKTGDIPQGPMILHDPNGTFITDGVGIGDIAILIASDQGYKFTTTVGGNPPFETDIFLNDFAPVHLTNVHYKIGARAQHTFATMTAQMKAAGPYSALIRWGWLWSNGHPKIFDPGETGQLITL